MLTEGVFTITNAITGEQYVGRSYDVPQRIRDYRKQLRCGKHQNRRLQAAWNAYGEAAFVFDVLWVKPQKARMLDTDFAKGDAIATLQPAYNVVGSNYVTANPGRVDLWQRSRWRP